MPIHDLPGTVDDKKHDPDCASDAPQSTTAPQTGEAGEATPGLDLRGYELMERLGGGGMGDVYRAGDPALGRDLAVKVIKADLQGYASAERRFLREARVTGSLQHPGIVPIHNLGRLTDGRLHYTMRLVRGRTFADILKEEAGRPERFPALLTIFEKICQAVAYAHSRQVLHRDLKPANVMVGRFGEVQVMDWGLAKVLTMEDEPAEPQGAVEREGTRIPTEDAETPLELTRMGREMGTPAYMPPEQALGEWDTVDERADVFALGAILCEILTGRSPYSGGDGREALRKAKRGELAEAWARLDGCGADAVLLGLCRDCLAPAQESRPRDAEQVAQRVAAYQAEVQERLQRVELERAAAVVQAREERKRRRWIIAAALLLLAGAAISTGLAVWGFRAAEAERQAKDLAQTRLGLFEKSNDVLKSVFLDLDPHAEEKGGPSLRQQLGQHLERAANQLDEMAVGDPVAVARIQSALGQSLINLGQAKLAIELLSKARMALESKLGADHPDTLICCNNLGNAYESAGRTADAIHLHEQILKQRKAHLGPDHPNTLTSRNNLANAYQSAGRTTEAIRLHEQTLRQREAKLGVDHLDTLGSRNNLAAVYVSAGRPADAIPLLEQSVKQLEAKLGADHSDTLISRSNLAESYSAVGRTSDAIRLHEQTLKQKEAKLGTDHPETLLSRNNLALAYLAAGRTAEAIRLNEQTLKQFEARLGTDHPYTLQSGNNLAEAYRAAGRSGDALRLHKQTLKQREITLGVDHPDTLKSRNNLALVYWSSGRTADALPLFEQNLKQFETKLGADHPNTLLAMANLGVAYRETGRLKDAIALLETALQRGRQRSDGLPASIAHVPGSLAETYERAGQLDKAESVCRNVLEQAQRQFASDDPRTGSALTQLGVTLLKQKKFTDAEPLLRQSLTILDKKQLDEWTTFNTRSALGEALLGQQKHTEAEPLLVQGYEGMKRRQDNIPPANRQVRLSEALERLVRLYQATNQKEKADDYRKKLDETKAVQKKTKP